MRTKDWSFTSAKPLDEPLPSKPRQLDINAARIGVNEAEDQLKAAREVLAQAERDETTRKLAEVRATLIDQQKQLIEMTKELQRSRGTAKRFQADVDRLTNAISQLTLERPAVADALPDDPEVKAWQKKYDRLQRQRDEAIAHRAEVGQTSADTLQAVRLENSINQLKYAEQNLLRKLSGEGLGWKGALNRVV